MTKGGHEPPFFVSYQQSGFGMKRIAGRQSIGAFWCCNRRRANILRLIICVCR
jgi:hypothetical protein